MPEMRANTVIRSVAVSSSILSIRLASALYLCCV